MKKLSAISFRLSAVIAAAAFAAACQDVHGDAPAPARPVKAAEASVSPATEGIRYAVSIQPYQQIPLAFKSSGYVDRVAERRGVDGHARALQAGDTVAAGAVLARVRESDYRERVNQADSSLRELDAAQAKATLDLDRARTLFAGAALTKPDLDAAQANFDTNVARIASARAQLEMADIALRDTALVAPSAGVILDRKIEVGSLVGGGAVGFVLGDIASVKAIFGVPDSAVRRITLGQPLAVTTEAYRGATFNGKVTAISPSADSQSRVFDIEVTIPNSDGRLRPGMIGAVETAGDAAAADTTRSAPSVPLSAIVRSETHRDEYAVFVIDEVQGHTSVHARLVSLGGVQGNLVAVTKGLAAGDRVVVMGATLLKDGEIVRVIP